MPNTHTEALAQRCRAAIEHLDDLRVLQGELQPYVHCEELDLLLWAARQQLDRAARALGFFAGEPVVDGIEVHEITPEALAESMRRMTAAEHADFDARR